MVSLEQSVMRESGPLLEVQNLLTWFPIRRGVFAHTVGHVKAVNDVSFFIRPRETLGLVGESGCGKTTLGRTLMGLERPVSGSIRFEGRDIVTVTNARRREVYRRMQMVFQDPYASLNPRMTVMDVLTEGLAAHGLLEGRREDAAARLLGEVGMPADAMYRYPFEFSGGQRQRISVARAMSLRPVFVVCDEAVSALDVSVQAQVLNLLMDLRESHHLSYLFISHDLGVVRHISDRVAVMYLGHIVETGRTEDVMGAPLHPYTQALLSALPAEGRPRSKKIVLQGEIPSPARPPAGCPFHTRCFKTMDICRSQFPEPRLVNGCEVSCHLYPPGPAAPAGEEPTVVAPGRQHDRRIR